MANIAELLSARGIPVSGYDVEERFPTDAALERAGISYITDPHAELPATIDLVAYSAAHGGSANSFVEQARRRGIETIHQAQLIGLLMESYDRSFAVAGCHGKTTTSSLLAYALARLDAHPGYLIGAPSFGGKEPFPGSAAGDGRIFVVEADEYATDPPRDRTPKFHHLHPSAALVTNIDFDHPDVFTDLEDTKRAFSVFMEGVARDNPAGALILCADDAPLMSVAATLPRESYVTYGFATDADFKIERVSSSEGAEGIPQESTLTISRQGIPLGTFSTGLFGDKNAGNVAGVVAMLVAIGYDAVRIADALRGFVGAKRRFELVGTANGTRVFDDYAHHPRELSAVIGAARARFPGARVVVLFQPHTFSRTESLKAEFAAALLTADAAVILPVFASAREQGVDPAAAAASIASVAATPERLRAAASREEAIVLARECIRAGDIIIMAGAGDIYTLKDDIMDIVTSLS
jgi:UDP-N-acetylmuramate--alanine ligase